MSLFKSLPFRIALGVYLLSFVRRIFRLPATIIYAQGAEDFIAGHILRHKFGITKGVYVDVGCNAPLRNSNTFDLYKQGWRGIVIDANQDLINEFRATRKEDICIRTAVSDGEYETVFHRSTEDAVSTIDKERLVQWKTQWEFREEDQEVVTTQTLTTILDQHLTTDIDLLSIDVEGHDLQVLKGLDLDKYRPKVIIIEIHDINNVTENPIYQHLVSHGYKLEAFAILSAYFIRLALEQPA